MKVELTHTISFIILLCFLCQHIFCQQNEDSILLARSEQWKVKQNKGMFGLAKPQFGPYTTTDIAKAGAQTTKKKTKEGSDISADISGEGVDFDQSKFLSILKTKNYKIQLATLTDTTNAVFAISSVSKEKRQTLFGKMISKNDEGKDEVLSYTRDVAGVITTSADEKPWIFCIDNYTSGSRTTAESLLPYA